MKGTHLINPKAASDCIASTSRKLGYANNYLSPFAKNAHEAGIKFPNQGKADDISVISAQIHTKGVYKMERE